MTFGIFDTADLWLLCILSVILLWLVIPRLMRTRTFIHLMGNEDEDKVQPRSVERFGTLATIALVSLLSSMWLESQEILRSEPGGVWEKAINKFDMLMMYIYKLAGGTAVHSMIVDHVSYRSFTLIELHTNKPAPWRAEDEFIPFSSNEVQAAAVLGYWITWGISVNMFGHMVG